MSLFNKYFATSVALLASLAPVSAQQKKGEAIYKNHDVSTYVDKGVSKTSIGWSACGSTPKSSGCYGGGFLQTGFHQVCAIMSGKETNGMRQVYVLDRDGNDFYLHSFSEAGGFKKGDYVSDTQPLGSIHLPIKGTNSEIGSCAMAANDDFIFASATDVRNGVVAKINKVSGEITPLPSNLLPAGTVSMITGDSEGYVTVNYNNAAGEPGGSAVYGPQGQLEQSGGSYSVSLNSANAVIVPKSNSPKHATLENHKD